MLDDIRQTRLQKIQTLRDLGVSPFVSARAGTFRTDTAKKIKSEYQHYEGKRVTVVGKIMLLRNIGKIAFATIQDESERIQLFFKDEDVKESDYFKSNDEATADGSKLSNKSLTYEQMNLLDIGDYVQAIGTIGKTKTGEVSVMVTSYTILSKSVRPMPEKFHGLQDTETRLRKRYLDLIGDAELREMFVKKSMFWKSIRDFLIGEGFTEVITPIMEETTGGADATPFTTHHNALDEDYYLRISPELHLKRLIGGGYEKVFEIGPNFRNEGIDDEHLQEFWNMEFYWAYANFWDNMELAKSLYRYIAKSVFNRSKFTMRGHEVDFDKEWEYIDYVETIQKKLGVNVLTATEEELKNCLRERQAKFEEDANRERLADLLWKQIRVNIAGPIFLINEPTITSPLARVSDVNPTVTERFHIIIAGSEIGNGYTELIDAPDQLARFQKQQAMRDAGDSEAQMIDYDFVEMLEYGMPPTTGFGMGERLFSFMVDKPMRQTVFFPQMGRKK
ncbi:lysine--tRNA ligase [bacterium]|nr:lysine--tRNA ligase [bacterium]